MKTQNKSQADDQLKPDTCIGIRNPTLLDGCGGLSLNRGMRYRELFVALLMGVLMLTVSGCERPGAGGSMDADLSAWEGETVHVQFRRDALGAAANLPVGPKTSSINGAETVLVGKLLRVHASSIVIEESDRQKWIPREVILYVQGPSGEGED